MPRALALLLVLVIALLAPSAQAFVDRIKPGEQEEPDADEGLLLVVVDSSTRLPWVKLKRLDGFFTIANLRRLESGRHEVLYRLPAGEYQWIKVQTFGEIQLADDPEFRFTVRPGRINYAGDLVVRPQTLLTTIVHVTNRGLAGMDWVRANHRTLADRYPFEYTGHYPDPFPSFYASELATLKPAAATLKPAAATPKPATPATEAEPARKARSRTPRRSVIRMGPDGLIIEQATTADERARVETPKPETPATEAEAARKALIESLWRTPRLSFMRMSPGGLLIAQTIIEDDKVRVEVHETDTGRTTAVLHPHRMVTKLVWADDERLVIVAGRERFLQFVSVVFVGRDAAGERSFDAWTLERLGHVVDVVPSAQQILFGTNGPKGELVVVPVSIATAASLEKFVFDPRRRLNDGAEGDSAWLADARGGLRIALVRRDDGNVLLERLADGTMRDLMTLDPEVEFLPLALSPGGKSMYVVTDHDREQSELVEFDLESRRIVGTLFAKPGLDIVDVHLDAGGRPIGVAWYDQGLPVTEFFDDADAAALAKARAAFGDALVLVQDRDAAGRRLVLAVEPPGRPLERHVWDTATGRATLVARSRPWLDNANLAATRVLRATARDGTPIETYLTLPRGDGPHPLVLMPHGGPIGVRDTLHFDPEVQFVASLGYAVLRVNFRGSSGYGRRFRESGHGKLGTAIEDDIDAAIALALEDPQIDAERLCAVGTSYGGFSALMSAIRWPGRFRCAVSIAGVTDRILFFTASDSGRTKDGRASLERVLGNPREELESMQRSSPLYRYRELDTPVLLIHGAEDYRVDFEHSLRLARMLALVGRPPQVMQLANAGHAIVDDENLLATWSATAAFLVVHLGSIDTEKGASVYWRLNRGVVVRDDAEQSYGGGDRPTRRPSPPKDSNADSLAPLGH